MYTPKRISRDVAIKETGEDLVEEEEEEIKEIPSETNLYRFERKNFKAISWKDETTNELLHHTIDTIEQLTSNSGVLDTRIVTLLNDDIKTPGTHYIARQYKSLVSQIAILYDMEIFERILAPYIQQKYEEINKPVLIPGSIGSYIFGCYLENYGPENLSRFCTPICAASIRVPNRSGAALRCRQKVIWTDGGETPVFILIEDTLKDTHSAKVFIPWPDRQTNFLGLTQGAIQEIKSFDVDIVQIYGQLPENTYIVLMDITPIQKVPIVARIYMHRIEDLRTPDSFETMKEDDHDQNLKTKVLKETNESSITILFILGGFLLIFIIYLFARNKSR